MPISLRTATALISTILATGCAKETETIVVEVDKQYSWKEDRRLHGLSRNVMSIGTDGNWLYLQHPFYFTAFTHQNTRNKFISYALGAPTDITLRVAIAPEFVAFPGDSALSIYRTTDMVTSGTSAYVRLRQLDRNAGNFVTRFSTAYKCTAISRNNYLLTNYRNTTPSTAYNFLLAAVSPGPYRVTVQPRIISIPGSSGGRGTVYCMVAIDDYFLVATEDGIYKVRENGTFSKVFSSGSVDGFYKWKGAVYAPKNFNSMLISNDDGETWQQYAGTPDVLNTAKYYVVRDSLIGCYFGALYSLHWDLPRFKIRALKTDGLERTTINDLATLGDTVYIGTDNGLFKRPIDQFFETKTE